MPATKELREERTETEAKVVKRPIVGVTCQYFPQGNMDAPPRPAIIMSVHHNVGRGVCQIKVFGPEHDTFIGATIRHINDPYHTDHPEALKMNGAWRYPSE